MSVGQSLRDAMEEHAAGRTSAEAVYETLKRAILEGHLEPGEIISQNLLYQDLAVSRTPVREAIRMLQAEGWITSERNRRVRVAQVSADDVEQFFATRIALEALAVGISAPRMTEERLAVLRDLLGAMSEALDAHDYIGWQKPHKAFHRTLTEGAGDVIGQSCVTLSASTQRYVNLYLTGTPVAWVQGERDHVAICQACIEQDGRAASSLLAKHLARTAIQIIAVLDPGRDPLRVRTAVNLISDPAIDVMQPPRAPL
jgi:DNA-binding GntR family transcriptional regulator